MASLIAVLQDGDNYKRQVPAECLGQIGDRRAVQPLVSALKDSEYRVMQAAEAALERINWRPGKDEAGAAYWIARKQWQRCVEIGTPAVDALISVLKEGDNFAKYEAADVLGQIGDTRAIDLSLPR